MSYFSELSREFDSILTSNRSSKVLGNVYDDDDVVIGGKDAKVAYSMPEWCAMSICSGIGTGLLFWAMGEPMFHFMTTQTAVAAAGSREAAIFAVVQAMWEWSFVFSTACTQYAELRLQLYVLTVRSLSRSTQS